MAFTLVMACTFADSQKKSFPRVLQPNFVASFIHSRLERPDTGRYLPLLQSTSLSRRAEYSGSKSCVSAGLLSSLTASRSSARAAERHSAGDVFVVRAAGKRIAVLGPGQFVQVDPDVLASPSGAETIR